MTVTTEPTDRSTMPAVALAAGDQTALVAALSDLIRGAWRGQRQSSRARDARIVVPGPSRPFSHEVRPSRARPWARR